MSPALAPEEQARVLIDEQLTRAGWHVCDRDKIDLVHQTGNAVREVIMKPDHGRADYLLYVDRKGCWRNRSQTSWNNATGVPGSQLCIRWVTRGVSAASCV